MNSCLSSLNSRYIFLFLSTNPFFISIVWSYNFLMGILSLAFLPKTQIYLWNLSRTSLLTSSSDFSDFSSSSHISYSSVALFISIVLPLFSFFSFFSFFFLLFLLLLFPTQFFLFWPLLLSTLLWTSHHFYLPCFPVHFRVVASEP